MKGGFVTVGQLVLASASPRRQRFLKELGLSFTVCPAAVDERVRSGEGPEEFVLRLAREKGLTVARKFPEACVLAADTVVALEGDILGKPADADQAEEMLGRLSGRWHGVWTGFALCRQADHLLHMQAVETRVLFRPLDRDLIRAYVRTGEPLDKAGSYGLQGRGGFLVERVEGSYSNVIGLPMAEVVTEFLRFAVIEPETGPAADAPVRGGT